MTPEEETQRAAEVAHLLGNRYLQEALQEIERAVVEQIVLCPVEKHELLRELSVLLRVKRKFEEILRAHVETGKMARLVEQESQKRASFMDKLKRAVYE